MYFFQNKNDPQISKKYKIIAILLPPPPPLPLDLDKQYMYQYMSVIQNILFNSKCRFKLYIFFCITRLQEFIISW